MADANLPDSNTLRLLGHQFSTDIKCGDYIESVARSAPRKFGCLYSIGQFFSLEFILHIYKSDIRPCI